MVPQAIRKNKFSIDAKTVKILPVVNSGEQEEVSLTFKFHTMCKCALSIFLFVQKRANKLDNLIQEYVQNYIV